MSLLQGSFFFPIFAIEVGHFFPFLYLLQGSLVMEDTVTVAMITWRLLLEESDRVSNLFFFFLVEQYNLPNITSVL